MYDFIFNWLYRYQKQGGSTIFRATAAMAVGSTFFVHVCLLLKIVEILTGIKIFRKFSEDYYTNKMYMLPYGVIYIFLFIVFYTHKRATAIINKYPKDYKSYTFGNFLYIFLIFFVPLVLLGWLANQFLQV